jgi:hypothetical protein
MLELTVTSPYFIVDSEDQLSTPTTTNVDKCFPNYAKMEQPIGKERVRGGGGGRGELALCVRIDILLNMGMGNGQPHA